MFRGGEGPPHEGGPTRSRGPKVKFLGFPAAWALPWLGVEGGGQGGSPQPLSEERRASGQRGGASAQPVTPRCRFFSPCLSGGIWRPRGSRKVASRCGAKNRGAEALSLLKPESPDHTAIGGEPRRKEGGPLPPLLSAWGGAGSFPPSVNQRETEDQGLLAPEGPQPRGQLDFLGFSADLVIVVNADGDEQEAAGQEQQSPQGREAGLGERGGDHQELDPEVAGFGEQSPANDHLLGRVESIPHDDSDTEERTPIEADGDVAGHLSSIKDCVVELVREGQGHDGNAREEHSRNKLPDPQAQRLPNSKLDFVAQDLADLGAVHLPVVILAAHSQDLAGLQAAHEVGLAVLLHERRGLLGCHLVLEPGLRGRVCARPCAGQGRRRDEWSAGSRLPSAQHVPSARWGRLREAGVQGALGRSHHAAAPGRAGQRRAGQGATPKAQD